MLTVNILFHTTRLRKIFNQEKELVRKYGADNARKIKRRIETLETADCLEQIPFKKPERLHELIGDRKGMFAVDLKHPHRLVFNPNHAPVPLKPDGGIDLGKVTAIEIQSVENYHS